MALKTSYQNDKFQGARKWAVTTNADNTISLTDVTVYETEGDVFNADDINATNTQVNTNISDVAKANTVIENNKAALTQLRTVTLATARWSASAPYTQTISISGMTAADSPTVGLIYPTSLTETQKANIDKGSNMITKIETTAGGIKFTCQFSKPAADIIIGLKGV